MTWTTLKKSLKTLSPETLIFIIQGLHGLSAQNKVWLENQISPASPTHYLEECRKKIAIFVYKPCRGAPRMPLFREAKKVIAEYKKTVNDPVGTLDLMLTFVEQGHAFTNDFGDIDGPFYDTLSTMIEKFAQGLRACPDAPALYETRFRARLMKLDRTSDIGWGYGDLIHDIFEFLEMLLEDEEVEVEVKNASEND